ncbi:MAG: hypothetical protein EXQ50_09975 [Acidobacteria bacterium]|nr:hypothetical protein [Acidobacteriota bacterium]
MNAELRARDPLLFWTGALMVLTLVVVTLLSIGDQRLTLGINPWVKPMKFLISITIFVWTLAWFMPEAKPDLVRRALVRWTVAGAMLIEIALITLQAARGTTSHFNAATAFDLAVFNIMGAAITVSSLAVVLFLWILRRDTPTRRAGYLWGVRLGVALFVLASMLPGFLMVANNGHSIPGPDGGAGLPFVNWSVEFGDLRVAHFLGMHAMQALPLLGFLLDRTIGGNQPSALVPTARNVVIAIGMAWFVVTGALLGIALLGRPIMAL